MTLSVYSYKLRIECMLLKEEFAANMSYLEPSINSMILAGEDLMTNKPLQEMLYMVLVAGNFLNSVRICSSSNNLILDMDKRESIVAFTGWLCWQCSGRKALLIAEVNGNSREQARDESDTLRSIGKTLINYVIERNQICIVHLEIQRNAYFRN